MKGDRTVMERIGQRFVGTRSMQNIVKSSTNLSNYCSVISTIDIINTYESLQIADFTGFFLLNPVKSFVVSQNGAA